MPLGRNKSVLFCSWRCQPSDGMPFSPLLMARLHVMFSSSLFRGGSPPIRRTLRTRFCVVFQGSGWRRSHHPGLCLGWERILTFVPWVVPSDGSLSDRESLDGFEPEHLGSKGKGWVLRSIRIFHRRPILAVFSRSPLGLPARHLPGPRDASSSSVLLPPFPRPPAPPPRRGRPRPFAVEDVSPCPPGRTVQDVCRRGVPTLPAITRRSLARSGAHPARRWDPYEARKTHRKAKKAWASRKGTDRIRAPSASAGTARPRSAWTCPTANSTRTIRSLRASETRERRSWPPAGPR